MPTVICKLEYPFHLFVEEQKPLHFTHVEKKINGKNLRYVVEIVNVILIELAMQFYLSVKE